VIDPEYEFYASLGVPLRTIYHWRKSRRPNRFARMLWQWFAYGIPASDSEEWNGWRFYRGELWSPEGSTFRPGDLRMLNFYRRNGLASGTCDAVLSVPDAGQVRRADLAPRIGSVAAGTLGAAARRSGRVIDAAISE